MSAKSSTTRSVDGGRLSYLGSPGRLVPSPLTPALSRREREAERSSPWRTVEDLRVLRRSWGFVVQMGRPSAVTRQRLGEARWSVRAHPPASRRSPLVRSSAPASVSQKPAGPFERARQRLGEARWSVRAHPLAGSPRRSKPRFPPSRPSRCACWLTASSTVSRQRKRYCVAGPMAAGAGERTVVSPSARIRR
jgi:hypothetical protein